MKIDYGTIAVGGCLGEWLSVMDAQIKIAEKCGLIETKDDWFYRHVKGKSN